MGSRLELQTLLENTIGNTNVYFQPPPSFQMAYPCIVYKPDDAKTLFADDNPYRYTKRYIITVMDHNSDSVVPDKIAMLAKCVFNRFYVVDKLHHSVFLMYF